MHSGSKHKFCIIFHDEPLSNALKHSQTSFWVEQVGLEVFVGELLSEVRYPEIVLSDPKHKFCMIFYSEVLQNDQK